VPQEKKNPIPIEDQTPSAKAAARLDEKVLEFRKAVHDAAPSSAFDQGDVVEISADVAIPSLTEHRVIEGQGKKGLVVAQSFVAGSESRHAGKVCRAVMTSGGDLVTTPEENLRRPAPKYHSMGTGLTDEQWAALWGKKKGTEK